MAGWPAACQPATCLAARWLADFRLRNGGENTGALRFLTHVRNGTVTLQSTRVIPGIRLVTNIPLERKYFNFIFKKTVSPILFFKGAWVAFPCCSLGTERRSLLRSSAAATKTHTRTSSQCCGLSFVLNTLRNNVESRVHDYSSPRIVSQSLCGTGRPIRSNDSR